MPVTLAEASKNVKDDIQRGVIDEFRKSSFLIDALTFDDAVTPGTSGATLTYGYLRKITEGTAEFRNVNEEYNESLATKQEFTVKLKIFGGAFSIDRIIAGMGGLVDELNFQMTDKVKAARALFHDTIINGDSAINAKAFDGLDKAVAGSSTQYFPNEESVTTPFYIDLSTEAALDAAKFKLLDELDAFLGLLNGKADVLAMNGKLLAKIRSVARRAGYWTQEKNSFGQVVEFYNGIPMVDLGEKPGSSNPIVQITNRSTDGSNDIPGLTDLYAIRFGLDAFHGVSMAGQPPIRTWLPDFSTAGAVKKGEVEMVAAVALKATKAAGVMRNIKVQ